MCCWKLKSVSFCSVGKKFEICNKPYSVRFLDSMRLINASLDNHVNNISNKITIKSVNTAWNVRIVKNAMIVKMIQ